uniref:Uncharacterized protein n=2 Tax=Arion vulgaris TaxID=1028688 RepID=A0A0B7B4F9_9EUPU
MRSIDENTVKFGPHNQHMSYCKCAKFHDPVFIITREKKCGALLSDLPSYINNGEKKHDVYNSISKWNADVMGKRSAG